MQRLQSLLRLPMKSLKPISSWQPLGNTEQPSDYRESGLYPIKLDEVLNERYQILRKLGHGMYSTVWLARDKSLSTYTALKVSVPIDISPDPELSALSKLNAVAPNVLQSNLPIPKLTDSFELQGVSGKHTVLVLELLGCTLRHLVDEIYDREMYGTKSRPVNILRGMVRQMVEAVNFVHSNRVVHRDIQLKNFQIGLQQSSNTIVENILRKPATILPPDAFRMNHFGKYGPPYIVEPEPLEDVLSSATLPPNLHVVLSDFGAATKVETASDGYQTYPLDVRSPEQILDMPITEKADLWALGCTIYHFVTLRHMFNIDGFASIELQDDEHLQGMLEVLGSELPEDMLHRWTRRESFVDEKGALLKSCLQDPLNDTLTDQITEDKPKGMSDQEALKFEEFIRFIMVLDPQKRPTAKEILDHPWLKSDTS